MKILFAGGGTLGPVTPLLAVAQAWKASDLSVAFVWVGTAQGPERVYIEKQGIPFFTLPVARIPRHPSREWILFPFKLVAALVKACVILRREKPDLIASAGGYTGVPLIIMGWFFGISSWIHQSDVLPLLSNKIAAPFARCITVAWKLTLRAFDSQKMTWIGNPVREDMLAATREDGVRAFGLDASLPTILVMGGGTGSRWMNETLATIARDLAAHSNVIHLTGKGKMDDRLQNIAPTFHVFEDLREKMGLALAAADVVVTRAGMGAITELSAFGKPAVVIPLPDSIQERNAQLLADTGTAEVLKQKETTPPQLLHTIENVLADREKQRRFSKAIAVILPTHVADRFVEHVKSHCLPDPSVS